MLLRSLQPSNMANRPRLSIIPLRKLRANSFLRQQHHRNNMRLRLNLLDIIPSINHRLCRHRHILNRYQLHNSNHLIPIKLLNQLSTPFPKLRLSMFLFLGSRVRLLRFNQVKAPLRSMIRKDEHLRL
jgi:hypothetical protein